MSYKLRHITKPLPTTPPEVIASYYSDTVKTGCWYLNKTIPFKDLKGKYLYGEKTRQFIDYSDLFDGHTTFIVCDSRSECEDIYKKLQPDDCCVMTIYVDDNEDVYAWNGDKKVLWLKNANETYEEELQGLDGMFHVSWLKDGRCVIDNIEDVDVENKSSFVLKKDNEYFEII